MYTTFFLSQNTLNLIKNLEHSNLHKKNLKSEQKKLLKFWKKSDIKYGAIKEKTGMTKRQSL